MIESEESTPQLVFVGNANVHEFAGNIYEEMRGNVDNFFFNPAPSISRASPRLSQGPNAQRGVVRVAHSQLSG